MNISIKYPIGSNASWEVHGIYSNMRLFSTKEPGTHLLHSDGNIAFSLRVGINTMLKTAWLFVRMADNTKLLLNCTFLAKFYNFARLTNILLGKLLPTSGLLCAGWGHICTKKPIENINININIKFISIIKKHTKNTNTTKQNYGGISRKANKA